MLTAAQLKRLMALMAKSATELNDAEKAELTNLKALAEAAKDGEGDMTADDVKKTVEAAVKAAMPAGSNLTEAQVKTIVSDALKGFTPGESMDPTALTAAVKAAMPATITTDDVKNIVTEALKGFRKDSKMVHENEHTDIELPIAHRSGNLSVDAKQLLNVMTKGADHINEGIPESILKDAQKRGEKMEKNVMQSIRTHGVHGAKAITTSGAGTGAEFMNSTLSSTLMMRFYLESLFASALVSSEIQMPTDNYQIPLSTTRPTFYSGSEGGDPDESTPGSALPVLTAKKLIGKVSYSYEADEDSIIAILPMILQQLGEAAAEAIENAAINGDTAATHQDSDIHAVARHQAKVWDGIRKLTLAQADLKLSLATGGISATNTGALRKLLKRWGINPKNAIILTGVNGYNDYVMLPETLTAEKVGDRTGARILTGMAPNLLGMDIIPSAAVREDLNASGVYDGVTTTKGSVFIVHKPSWIMGVRRGFTIEQDKDISLQKKFVVASFRRDFKPVEGLDKTKAAAIGYNYTS
jgi:hypothetical protein